MLHVGCEHSVGELKSQSSSLTRSTKKKKEKEKIQALEELSYLLFVPFET